MADKRRFLRLDMSVGVTWEKRAPGTATPVQDIDATRNIGAGGLCLVADEAFRPGEELNLALTLPTGKICRGVGRVVWVGRSGDAFETGVVFEGAVPSDWDEIKKFVATLE
jgi:hypothetical protein